MLIARSTDLRSEPYSERARKGSSLTHTDTPDCASTTLELKLASVSRTRSWQGLPYLAATGMHDPSIHDPSTFNMSMHARVRVRVDMDMDMDMDMLYMCMYMWRLVRADWAGTRLLKIAQAISHRKRRTLSVQ